MMQKVDELLAWSARNNAALVGNTAVGAVVRGRDGNLYAGCNIEHPFRCHDIHAEVCAISAMVAEGCHQLEMILIVAERELFTPCGGCLDWIFRFGGPDCVVAFQGKKGGEIQRWKASELMPHYPK